MYFNSRVSTLQLFTRSISKLTKSATVLFISFLSFGQSVIFSNDITNANPSANNPFTAGQTISSGITVSGIGRGSGVSGNSLIDSYSAKGWDNTTINLDDYFEWTISPTACTKVDFNSFVFTSQVSNTRINKLRLRSSLDNFANDFSAPIAPTNSNVSVSNSVSLSSSIFQNITEAVTFRLYAYGSNGNTPSANSSLSINDFQFTGVISSILPSFSLSPINPSICLGNSIDITNTVDSKNPKSIVAFNSFEIIDTWSYSNSNGFSSSGNSTSNDRPQSTSFVNSGSNSFSVKNSVSNIVSSNVTGLANYTNKAFQFNLSAFSIGSTSNGLDGTDSVTVAISIDGGNTYSKEATVKGNNNAYWSFSSGIAQAVLTYDGNNNPQSFSPSGGGNRTTDGFGLVKILLPESTEQVMVKIYLNNNNTSEQWVIDDLMISGIPLATYAWTSNPSGFTSSVQNPTVAPTETTTYTVTATNAYGCSSSSNTTVTLNPITTTASLVNTDYVWTGRLSTDYTDPSNWISYNGSSLVQATTIPASTNNVIIPANQTCVLNQPNTFANAGNAKDITIEPSASLSMGSGSLNVYGNWTNNGTYNSGTGTVTYAGTATQVIGGSSISEFYNLSLNNNHSGVYPSHVALKLEQDIKIANQLTLIDGIFDVFNNNLTLGTTNHQITILPSLGTADSYIAAHHNLGTTGSVVQFVHGSNVGNGTNYSFPIGDDGKWTPYTIAFNAGTSIAAGSTITSHVNDALIAGSTNPAFTDRIVRDWEVNPSVGITNPNYSVQIFHNNDVLESGTTASTTLVPFKKSGSTLYAPIGTFNTPSIVEVGSYVANVNSYTWSNLTSFSNFGGTDMGISQLPVELTSFNAICEESKGVSVSWSTASEHNSSHFDVLKSEDGNNWRSIAIVAAAGNSTSTINYGTVDAEKATGVAYYKLMQYDIDGQSKEYGPISSDCNQLETMIVKTFPNPSGDEFYVELISPESTSTVITIIDAQGKSIYARTVETEKGTNLYTFESLNVLPGMYYIQISNDLATPNVVKHSFR